MFSGATITSKKVSGDLMACGVQGSFSLPKSNSPGLYNPILSLRK